MPFSYKEATIRIIITAAEKALVPSNQKFLTAIIHALHMKNIKLHHNHNATFVSIFQLSGVACC